MLKISTIDTKTERRLVVEGKLVDAWVAELKKSWEEANENLEGRKLVVDLSNATIISRESEEALLDLMNEGARFSCCGVLNKYVLKQMIQKFQDAVSRKEAGACVAGGGGCSKR